MPKLYANSRVAPLLTVNVLVPFNVTGPSNSLLVPCWPSTEGTIIQDEHFGHGIRHIIECDGRAVRHGQIVVLITQGGHLPLEAQSAASDVNITQSLVYQHASHLQEVGAQLGQRRAAPVVAKTASPAEALLARKSSRPLPPIVTLVVMVN